jgi:hypothetical protein
MRTLLIAAAASLALAGTALAQMCGAPSGTSQTAQAGGMAGCMGMMRQAQDDDPMADKPAEKQAGGMMCPCCKNMAMMGGMKQDAQPKGAEPKHDMPMPAPKQ